MATRTTIKHHSDGTKTEIHSDYIGWGGAAIVIAVIIWAIIDELIAHGCLF